MAAFTWTTTVLIANSGQRRILVVEDDCFVRADIVCELVESGFAVVEADSVEKAMTVLRDGRMIDLLFTDIRLNGPGNGHDVADAVRALRPGIPVIYTSGQAIDPRRRVPGSLAFGKPYRPEEVVAACQGLTLS
jgi:CheY-like chemotaxis protein